MNIESRKATLRPIRLFRPNLKAKLREQLAEYPFGTIKRPAAAATTRSRAAKRPGSNFYGP